MSDHLESAEKTKPLIRYIQALVFILIYMGMGLLLKLGPNGYLICGIPLTLLFQYFICKKPIHNAWVRDGIKFQLNKWGILIAAFLCILPIKLLVTLLLQNKFNFITLYCVATVLGAFAAGYSLTKFTKGTVRLLLLCLVIAGSIGILISIASAFAKGVHPQLLTSLRMGIKSLLLYFPACFMIEEVVFRGVIDSHIYRPGEKRGIISAIFVSVLWGLWHLPVVPIPPNAGTLGIVAQVVFLIVAHTLVGVPMSIFWRKSGNLAVTSFTHAFIDAVRNALLS